MMIPRSDCPVARYYPGTEEAHTDPTRSQGMPQSPRWRVGLVCARMRTFLLGNKFGKRFRNPLNVTSYRPIRLTSAVPASNPMTSMVSLLPSIKPNLSQSDRILIIAADLTDAYGRPIDGNDDGLPGGNYVATLSRSGVTFGAVPLAVRGQPGSQPRPRPWSTPCLRGTSWPV